MSEHSHQKHRLIKHEPCLLRLRWVRFLRGYRLIKLFQRRSLMLSKPLPLNTLSIMATRKLPDLLNDSKLLVELHGTHAHYFSICNDNSAGQIRRRTWKKETWTRTKRLGGGATGEVWLEKCHTGDKTGQLQAVKVISKGSQFDIYQELETIAKFSQSTSKVSILCTG